MIAVQAEMHFFAKRYKTRQGRQEFGLIIFLDGFVVSEVKENAQNQVIFSVTELLSMTSTKLARQ